MIALAVPYVCDWCGSTDDARPRAEHGGETVCGDCVRGDAPDPLCDTCGLAAVDVTDTETDPDTGARSTGGWCRGCAANAAGREA